MPADVGEVTFTHSEETLFLHNKWARVLHKCVREIRGKEFRDLSVKQAIHAKKVTVLPRNKKDVPKTYYKVTLEHHKGLRQAVDLGVDYGGVMLPNGQQLRLESSMKRSDRPNEYLLDVEGFQGEALEGELALMPKTGTKMLEKIYEDLIEHPEFYPVNSAVGLLEWKPGMAEWSSEQWRTGEENIIQFTRQSPFHCIWGPPGCGKTYISGKIIEALLSDSLTGYIFAQSNMAVDAVGQKLKSQADRDPHSALGQAVAINRITRIGTSETPLALGEIALMNRAEGGFGNSWMGIDQFTLMTVYGLLDRLSDPSMENRVRPRDVVLIDEASTVNLLNLYFLSCFGSKKVIVVGDHCQLPPVFHGGGLSKTTKRAGEKNIMRHWGYPAPDVPDPRYSILTQQRRMLAENCDLVHELGVYPIYETAPEMIANPPAAYLAVKAMEPFAGKCLGVIDTSDYRSPKSGGNVNHVHLEFVKRLAGQFYRQGTIGKIGIMTPYRNQANEYVRWGRKSGMEGMTIGTVNAFQGQESHLCVWDIPDSPLPTGGPSANDLTDEIRYPTRNIINNFTVAVTRHHAKLIVVANVRHLMETLSEGAFLRKLIQRAEATGSIIPAQTIESLLQLPPLVEEIQAVEFPKDPFTIAGADVLEAIKADIGIARRSVDIYSPTYDLAFFSNIVGRWLKRLANEKQILVRIFTPKKMDKADREIIGGIMRNGGNLRHLSLGEWPHPAQFQVVVDWTVYYENIPALLNQQVKPQVIRNIFQST